MIGMSKFVETHKESNPDIGFRFDQKDAVIRAGFGPIEEIEAVEDGDAFQSDDGKRKIIIDDNDVILQNEQTKLTLKNNGVDLVSPNGPANITVTGDVNITASGNVAIVAAHVTDGGVEIDRHHTHQYTQPQHPAGQGDTGTPQ